MTIEQLVAGIQHCIGSAPSCRGCPYVGNPQCAQLLTRDLLGFIEDVKLADPRWVSVTDRVPHRDPMNDTRYEVCTKTKRGIRNINIAWFDGQSWHGTGTHANVTHWRELPRLPEGGRAV